ncbi:MAG: SWIM zinc finger family protein [Halorientalis sp.]
MTVLPEGGDVFTVVSESGSEYRVDAVEGRCTCPDSQQNLSDDERCKHERRVAFATGDRPVPSWVNTDAVDSLLGDHVEGGPVVAASDGGVLASYVDRSESDGDGSDGDGDDSGRPDDCECGAFERDIELPCWPCYREGFEEPADTESA